MADGMDRMSTLAGLITATRLPGGVQLKASLGFGGDRINRKFSNTLEFDSHDCYCAGTIQQGTKVLGEDHNLVP